MLFCRDKLKKHIEIDPRDQSKIEWYDRALELSSGESSQSLDGIRAMVGKALETGKYKIIAYQPEIPKKGRENIDPEREGCLYSFLLRRIAETYHLPLVIISPCEPDENAPKYPGIPVGVRQYWHCPKCLAKK